MAMAAEHATTRCLICLEGNPPPIQCGCACRGASGLAHVACKIREAQSKRNGQTYHAAWHRCGVCTCVYSGDMRLALAEEICRRCEQGERERLSAHPQHGAGLGGVGLRAAAGGVGEGPRRRSSAAARGEAGLLDAQGNLGNVLQQMGRHAEAETLQRAVVSRDCNCLQRAHSMCPRAARAHACRRTASARALCVHAAAKRATTWGGRMQWHVRVPRWCRCTKGARPCAHANAIAIALESLALSTASPPLLDGAATLHMCVTTLWRGF